MQDFRGAGAEERRSCYTGKGSEKEGACQGVIQTRPETGPEGKEAEHDVHALQSSCFYSHFSAGMQKALYYLRGNSRQAESQGLMSREGLIEERPGSRGMVRRAV